MKTSGTPCGQCRHGGKQGYEHPCCNCISNEDIAMSRHFPNHEIDFVYFEAKDAEPTERRA